MMRRPLLYIAAPYTQPDPVVNTHRVIKVADVIYAETAWVPIVPHLTMLWHAISPKPIEHWYEYDLQILEHCGAIVRLPGASTGADKEMDHARREGIHDVPFVSLPVAAIRAWIE